MDRPTLLKVVRVRDSHHDLGTEQSMRRVERGEDVARGQDRVTHGGKTRLGSLSGIQAAAARTLLAMIPGRDGGGRGKEVQRHGRPVLPSLVDSSSAGLLDRGGGISDLARRR